MKMLSEYKCKISSGPSNFDVQLLMLSLMGMSVEWKMMNLIGMG